MPPKSVMKKKAMIDPKKKGMLSIIGSAMCDVKKIDCMTDTEVKDFMESVKVRSEYPTVEAMPDALQTIRADVITTMNLDHDLQTSALVYPVQESVDPKKVYTLPKLADSAVIRVVVTYGSHEVFVSKNMEKSLGSMLGGTGIGTFVPMGSAIKLLASSGDFSYDNKDTYDSEMYPGGGRKRPTKRQLIIFDFISTSEDVLKKVQGEELSRITGLVTKIPQASSVILPLIQALTSGKSSA